MCKTWGRLQPGVSLAVVRPWGIFCACHGTRAGQHGSLPQGVHFTENGSFSVSGWWRRPRDTRVGIRDGEAASGLTPCLRRLLRAARASRTGRGHTPCRLGSPSGPDVREALERPPMPAHARGGHPGKVGARTGQEPGRAARRAPRRHVRVPAPIVDQFVLLPGLIRQRPHAECLLDRRTLLRSQGLGGLLPRPRGGLLHRGGGVVGAYLYPLPPPPGRFPLRTGLVEAWASHFVSLRPDRGVTLWDVIP